MARFWPEPVVSLQCNKNCRIFQQILIVFFIRARRVRKALGGGWRQAGVLAAAGLVALNQMIDRLQIDHEHTYKIAKGLS